MLDGIHPEYKPAKTIGATGQTILQKAAINFVRYAFRKTHVPVIVISMWSKQ